MIHQQHALLQHASSRRALRRQLRLRHPFAVKSPRHACWQGQHCSGLGTHGLCVHDPQAGCCWAADVREQPAVILLAGRGCTLVRRHEVRLAAAHAVRVIDTAHDASRFQVHLRHASDD